MKSRFALSVAGLATATMGVGTAHAGGVSANYAIEVNLHLDYWAAETSSVITGESGSFGHYFSSVSGYLQVFNNRSEDLFAIGYVWDSAVSAYTSGFGVTIWASVSAGTYDVQLFDSYGDGWVWNNVDGADAFSVRGLDVGEAPGGYGEYIYDASLSGSTTLAMQSNSVVSGSFEVLENTGPVVPSAPAAAALLGLAGISGRRKRG